MMEQESPLTDLSSVDVASRIKDTVQAGWEKALGTDQYEVAQRALGEVTALNQWRQVTHQSSFSPFYSLIESATALNQAAASPEERTVITDQLVGDARRLSPRVQDLYLGLLSKLDETSYTPQFEMTQRQLTNLTESGDLALLQDPSVPWDIKLNRMQNRIESELRGRKALDRRDKAIQETQSFQEGFQSEQSTPPSERNESKPGMDEMQRLKEGEQASAIWTIEPAWGGYYKEQSFDTWDAQRNTWVQSEYQFSNSTHSLGDGSQNTVRLRAVMPAGRTVRLPIPYTHQFMNIRDIDIHVRIFFDQNGDVLLRSDSSNDKEILVRLEGIEEGRSRVTGLPTAITMPSVLTEETENKLTQVQNTRRTTLERARSLASYTMRRLKYSNDSSFNAIYNGDPDGYAGAIDKYKQADCDVANTYFATLCSRLNIPVRHVVGHMVKGKDSEGNARITSGTGHAWTEVWDNLEKKWQRVDATPPGDPQLEQDEQGQGMPGDYGEQEAIGPTDEELLQLQEQLTKVAEALSYTQEERELSEATGIDLPEARKIVKEIQVAEETRLPNGERVVDVMSQLWSLITQSRIVTTPEYTGSLRKREGGEEIEDIIAQKIGVLAGDSDPASRQKEFIQQASEPVIHQMQTRILGDKSGSMGQMVDGVTKWNLQRRAQYLILSSLDRAEKNLQRASSRMTEPLAIQTQVISFRDQNTIDVDKPLSTTFSLEDKVRLWHSLGNQGWGNGDVAGLQYFYNEIQAEREEVAKQGKEDDTLRVVIACSDGEPDDVERVHQMAQSLGELNAVVVGVGLTETAAKVPLIFDTPYSRGDIARDLNDLPAILVKHVVMEAVKLFPEKSRESYQRTIDALLAKFERVG